MNTKIIIPFLCFCMLSISCTNYDSERYIQTENQAIQDIILELIDFEYMSKGHSTNSQKLNLYLNATLDTIIVPYNDPYHYEDEDLNKYRKEQISFLPFKTKRIKKRELHHTFEYPNLDVKLVTDIDRKPLHIQEMGYLYISRVIFNNRYDKGYLSYAFFCGEACFWNNNIEIIKVNGVWKVSEEFSGGIA